MCCFLRPDNRLYLSFITLASLVAICYLRWRHQSLVANGLFISGLVGVYNFRCATGDIWWPLQTASKSISRYVQLLGAKNTSAKHFTTGLCFSHASLVRFIFTDDKRLILYKIYGFICHGTRVNLNSGLNSDRLCSLEIKHGYEIVVAQLTRLLLKRPTITQQYTTDDEGNGND